MINGSIEKIRKSFFNEGFVKVNKVFSQKKDINKIFTQIEKIKKSSIKIKIQICILRVIID